MKDTKELKSELEPGRSRMFGADFQETDSLLWLCLEFLFQQWIDYALLNKKSLFLLSGP